MGIDVRPIRDGELVDWLDAQTTGFLERPDVTKVADEVREHWDVQRLFGAFDGDRVVGTARTWPTEVTVPGNRTIKASALTGVAVRPTHRRQGLLRRLLGAEHAAARERGEVASLLHASEALIYDRFGYGPRARRPPGRSMSRQPAFTRPRAAAPERSTSSRSTTRPST
jgi:predicted acetyltransferase